MIGGLAALAFTVYAVADCALTERDRVAALPRALWIVLILVLPVVGALLWFLLGRVRTAPSRTGRTIGPDDDPEFLRAARRPPDRPARGLPEPDWRQLEQELAIDSDQDDEGDARRR